MTRYMNTVLGFVCACAALMSCSKIEAWEEGGVVIPNRVHYSVSTAELVETDADGVSSINGSLLRYDISLYDDKSSDRGLLSIIAPRGAESFDGTYRASSAHQAGSLLQAAVIDENGALKSLDGTVEIAQNALNSLSVSMDGEEYVHFAKGSGVPQHSRAANTDCCRQYLISHTAAYGEGKYIQTLSIGGKGVSCTEGEYYDTYGGTGEYLIIKFVTETETLGEGTFGAAALDEVRTGSFMAGKTVDSGWGFSYIEGSQFCTLADGDSASGTAKAVTGGELQISLSDAEKELYSVSGTLILEDGTVFTIAYTGRLTPEPAPERDWNVWTAAVSKVYTFDWSTYNYVEVPGVKMYIIEIKDPRDETLAVFRPIVDETAADFLGSFAVQENAVAAGLMINGYDASAWGQGIGGSYFYEGDDLNLICAGSTVAISGNPDGGISFSSTGGGVLVNGSSYVVRDFEIKAYSADYKK